MHIKKAKKLRVVSTGAFCVLGVIGFLGVFPITKTSDDAEATYVPATTTLSIVSSKDTASVDITPTSASGTFATSAAADMAEFTVTTDNLTGYSLNILGTDTSGQLVNSTTGDTLDTITSDTTENDFKTGNASTYNNKWGYRLTVNSATTTNFFSAPTSTSTAKTIYTTSAPNTTGTSDSFTLGVGARVDYTKPVGTYTNTFVLTAVANNITYAINYLDNTGDTITDLPAAEGSSNITASSFTLSSTEPQRTGYDFIGWCDGTVTHVASGTDTCAGTTYQAGDTYTFTNISSTSTNTANLYAMWEDNTVYMQDLTPSQCTTTPMTVKDNRDNQEYVIQRLADDNCWMMTNLNLGATTLTTDLTSSNTNFSSTITASTFNSWKKSSGSNSYTAAEYIPVSGTDNTSQTPYGTLYNYCATSAGTICTSSNSSNASYDICPAGWRLPTGGSSGEFQALSNNSSYNAYAKIRAPYTNGGAAFALAGFFNNAAPGYQGSYGRYWSSTRYNDTLMHRLGLNASSVYPAEYDGRGVGGSIRCVMKQTMQNFTTQEAESMATGESRTLVDSRDGKSYTVGKLADGNVWMKENLRLDISDATVQAKLNSTTTNATDISLGYLKNGGGSSPYPANGVIAKTASSGSWADSYNNPYIATQYEDTTQAASGSSPAGKIGIYYNYCAASAGSYCYAANASSGDASQDICPAGWHLPTGGASGQYQALYTAYSSNVANFEAALSTPLSGYFVSGAANSQGTYGYFWSSTRSNGSYMYRLRVDASAVSPQNNDIRLLGFSVRCVFGS